MMKEVIRIRATGKVLARGETLWATLRTSSKSARQEVSYSVEIATASRNSREVRLSAKRI